MWVPSVLISPCKIQPPSSQNKLFMNNQSTTSPRIEKAANLHAGPVLANTIHCGVTGTAIYFMTDF